eukprot:SAG31_NODE_10128_length_1179_cov_2.702778_1_plen_90_part_00
MEETTAQYVAAEALATTVAMEDGPVTVTTRVRLMESVLAEVTMGAGRDGRQHWKAAMSAMGGDEVGVDEVDGDGGDGWLQYRVFEVCFV